MSYDAPGTDARPPRIAFLLYYSRSGSTFLSSRLDRYEDTGVSLESGFMRTLILKKELLQNTRDPEEAYALLKGSSRFDNLGVSLEGLVRYLKPEGGYGVGELGRAVLAAHFEDRKPDAEAWVVKDGPNGYWMNQISRELPDARFVHVLRDGRAVLNSGLNNVRPYAVGERMARDPATVARTWTRFVETIDGYAVVHPGHVLQCRYEDLMADEAGEVSRVREFLGLGAVAEPEAQESGGYYERLPEREKAIHRLISGSPERGRVEAWREELARGDRLVFEFRAAVALRKHGYRTPDERRLPSLLADRDFVAAYSRSGLLRARDWARLLLNTGKLRRVLETKVLHRRERRT